MTCISVFLFIELFLISLLEFGKVYTEQIMGLPEIYRLASELANVDPISDSNDWNLPRPILSYFSKLVG